MGAMCQKNSAKYEQIPCELKSSSDYPFPDGYVVDCPPAGRRIHRKQFNIFVHDGVLADHSSPVADASIGGW
jgi:hypothetical protein